MVGREDRSVEESLLGGLKAAALEALWNQSLNFGSRDFDDHGWRSLSLYRIKELADAILKGWGTATSYEFSAFRIH